LGSQTVALEGVIFPLWSRGNSKPKRKGICIHAFLGIEVKRSYVIVTEELRRIADLLITIWLGQISIKLLKVVTYYCVLTSQFSKDVTFPWFLFPTFIDQVLKFLISNVRLFRMLYSFFWMIPRLPNFMCRRFGTPSVPSL